MMLRSFSSLTVLGAEPIHGETKQTGESGSDSLERSVADLGGELPRGALGVRAEALHERQQRLDARARRWSDRRGCPAPRPAAPAAPSRRAAPAAAGPWPPLRVREWLQQQPEVGKDPDQ